MESSTPSRQASDYTIGLVCALPLERAALEAILDEEHPVLPAKERDDNQYSFGRIGPHNTVIAGLPSGVTGSSSAASVASHLMRSFPSTRFGLLVGIGGGAPMGSNDIRLGDVVVSKPTNNHGGVVQYDFGKTGEMGQFKRTGTLNKPPTILLSAIAQLEARHERIGPDFSRYISKAMEAYPRMSNTFSCPGEKLDRLFETTYEHERTHRTCDECDSRWLKERPPRQETNSHVHYGNIASANQVMKHAGTRDRIAVEENIICFEMEAAGLMDWFPCLVIRGICDYADSHKNDIWQRYAALAAAAFAKELLCKIPPEEVKNALPAGNVHWLVPRTSSAIFTGRTDVLRRLGRSMLAPLPEGQVRSQRRCVIAGIGGSGKSEVCLKFAEQHRERFWGVFWIDASSSARAEAGFITVAETCGARERTADAARAWLANTRHSWLLILDNADDREFDYASYFPSGDRGCILLTTREPDCSAHATVAYEEFEKLEEDDAMELLLKASGCPEVYWEAKKPIAQLVLEDLQRHALAIVQAGAYVRQGLCFLEEYPGLFKVQRRQLMMFRPKQARSTYGDVYATFEVSALALENSSDPCAKAALHLLGILGFMHFQGVTESIFSRAANYSRELLRKLDEKPEDPPQWEIDRLSNWHTTQAQWPDIEKGDHSAEFDMFIYREARSILASFSLISVAKESQSISMHPLVNAWATDRMDQMSYWMFWSTTGSMLALATEEKDGYQSFFTDLQPHIEACTSTSLRPKDCLRAPTVSQTFQVLYRLGWTLCWLDSYQKAHFVAKMLYDVANVNFEAKSRNMRLLAHFFAVCRMDIGKAKESAQLLERIVSMNRILLAHDDPERLDSEYALALACMQNGQHEIATSILEKVVSIRKETLKESHQARLISEHALACAYIGTGQYEPPIEALERLVSIRKETLEESHPKRLALEEWLAYAYLRAGQHARALKLQDKVVQIRRDTLPPGDSSRLTSQHNLAHMYNEVGQYEQAITLLKEVVSMQEVTLPAEDPFRLMSGGLLADVRLNLSKAQNGGLEALLNALVTPQKRKRPGSAEGENGRGA